MVDQYTVRTEGNMNTPVVKPPVGEDIYLVARLWNWWPIFELEVGKSYRLHIMSMDWQHGFSLQPSQRQTSRCIAGLRARDHDGHAEPYR
ncbi:MAG: hypothetical protein U5Q16_15800 [Gammaproteobacteria bacterium]|nr:hypothetical protein [Gammaproteobacteria bacterium]